MWDPIVERFEALRRAFLAHMPEEPHTIRARFGSITSAVLKKLLKAGDPPTVDQLIVIVHQRFHTLASDAPALDEQATLRHYANLMLEHPYDVRGYMEWALWWQDQPPELQQLLRDQRLSDIEGEKMPPTPGQLSYLEKLGHRGYVSNRTHARRLIEEYVAAHAGRI